MLELCFDYHKEAKSTRNLGLTTPNQVMNFCVIRKLACVCSCEEEKKERRLVTNFSIYSPPKITRLYKCRGLL